ncbi:uncharacterized protein LOC108821333 isoform X1 [Raphanus sativus]|uniref:Uncharacterized protein LOC108821333 isoform X1 n=1 Tax=Raphanus sativus TaxID=3726 RepID=A0A9W3DD93_RAPSA|nr:uncharacterized protein LOC108821333 isoform X1 [Raphanus sativus]
MEEERHGQNQRAKLSQHLTALQEVEQIAQLRKRRKAQGKRPQPGERRFGDAPEAVYVEPKPPDPSRINKNPNSKTPKLNVVNSHFDYNSFANKFELFKFSGKRGYLRWERNLDEWFHYNNILKEERLAYAIDHLKGDAFKWWVQEVDDRWFYKEPTIKTWGALKKAMRYEFAPGYTRSHIKEQYPRRYPTHGSQEAREAVQKEGQGSLPQQTNFQPNQGHAIVHCLGQKSDILKVMEVSKNVSQDTLSRPKEELNKPVLQAKAMVSLILDKLVYISSPTGMSHLSLSKDIKTGLEVQKDMTPTPLLESRVVHDLFPRKMEIPNQKKEKASTQGKSSNLKFLKDQTCYRCHKIGHFVVTCPTKQALIQTSLEKKTDLSIKSDSFIQSDLLVQNSGIMHLFLPRNFDPGITKEREPRGRDLTSLVRHTINITCAKQNEGEAGNKEKIILQLFVAIKVSMNFKYSVFKSSTTDIMHLSLPRNYFSDTRQEGYHTQQDKRVQERQPSIQSCPKKNLILHHADAPMVNSTISHSVYETPVSDIIHFVFVQNVENFSGCKEESFKRNPTG